MRKLNELYPGYPEIEVKGIKNARSKARAVKFSSDS